MNRGEAVYSYVYAACCIHKGTIIERGWTSS
jgi:hypothetical protein